jgi:hypothetical protein
VLTHYDDFPLHQTPEPVAHPATSDKNFYDRYFFNGFARDGSLFFALALGLYPNRRVMDASFSVLADGRQLDHARACALERGETRDNPIEVPSRCAPCACASRRTRADSPAIWCFAHARPRSKSRARRCAPPPRS